MKMGCLECGSERAADAGKCDRCDAPVGVGSAGPAVTITGRSPFELPLVDGPSWASDRLAISREWVAFKDVVAGEVPWNVIPYTAVSSVLPVTGGGIVIRRADGLGVMIDQTVLASAEVRSLLTEGLSTHPALAPAAAELLQPHLEAAGESGTGTGQPLPAAGQQAPRDAPTARLASSGVSWRGALVLIVLVVVIVAVAIVNSSMSSAPSSSAPSSSAPSSSAPSLSAPSTSAVRQWTEDQLRPGECLRGSNLPLGTNGSWPLLFTTARCTHQHIAEVFFAGNIWPPPTYPYPGDNGIYNKSRHRCAKAFAAYTESPLYRSAFTFDFITPDNNSWYAGDRLVVCIAYKPTSKYPGGAPVAYSIKKRHQ